MTDALPRECPPAEMLGAFLEGKLNEMERAEIARHLEGCPECMFVLGEAGRFEREERTAPGEVVPFRRPSRWWLAAAAALVLIAGGAILFQRIRPRDPMARMIALASEVRTRPVVARISGFPWAPAAAVTRGSGTDADAALLKLRGAAGEVIERSAANDAESLHQRGVGYLVAGNPDEAVRTLERATQLDAGNARYVSDLSAAQYTKAIDSSGAEAFAIALTSADRAIELDPQLPEARFNRALILEGLRRYGEARKEYTRFLQLDPGSAWAAEARTRLARLPT